ncbi:ABC transporter substrate-binding protein [Wenxinia saemankumensis]|uniref:Peptide/nickel transport system substrate-binding protein n=1 Tax=Wenxinia saemankumensis TaxID=1447782 RepID=A0A1M6A2Q0_9RHOB|nr:ABC transporter substrate-binding protein [Wenxinia saemankumensis]SHI30784.1 peptide/nickel transport system substrate-binding protein [Wenxinia saemankumensis]
MIRTTLLASTACLIGAAAAAQTLDVALDVPPAGLDPHLVTAFNSVLIASPAIYEGLTSIDNDLNVQPGLATDWTISEDGLTYTFTIVEGATFHDGSALTAEDVAASLRRVQSEDIASPLASRIDLVTGIEAVDDTTVELTLSAPFAPLLASLAGIAIVPAEFETDPEALQQTPVGTGPFRFEEWQPNGYISLTAFDGYRVEGQPALDEVRFHFVPESATAQAGLLSGDYDLLPTIDPATALMLEGQPDLNIQTTRDLAYTLIGMNASVPPFDQPEVRRAVNLLLNRQEIIDAALFGAGVPAGPLSPALTSWALDVSEFDCYTTDVDAATALLEEAGVETPVQVRMIVLPRQDARDIAQVAQQQLAAGGFELTLENQEIGTFVQDWRNGNFDMFVSANGGNVDPDLYFYRTFFGGGSTNVFQYADDELDAMLDEARSLTGTEARKEIYDEIQRKLACEGPVAHIAYADLSAAVAEGVSGYTISPIGRIADIATIDVAE